MPWSNQGGGGWQGGGGQGPWGRPPGGGGSGGGGGGGGGGPAPDLEDLIRRGQDRVKRWMPGLRGTRGIILLILIGIAIWLASGFYRVQPDEVGVVLRFGKWTKTTQPGLNYHLPAPFETVLKPKVTRVNRAEIGFRSAVEGGSGRNVPVRPVPGESLMLTGDENIIDIHFTVLWVINREDVGKYLFNVRSPELTVKDVAESAMREVIGKSNLQSALAEGRTAIAQQAQELTERILDQYGAGIDIRQVELQKIDPPEAVIDAFRDVQAARADQERSKNEAEAYRNDILPRAKGEAERLLQEAAAYREEVVARANGETQRFLKVYDQYKLATDVTRKRLYLETMEQILAGMNKIVIDPSASGSGVVPYLPLPEVQRRQQSQPSTQPSAQGGQQ
ncbi:MAG: FtsH protease activity modulator HflK [Alphaproteobacteria bacterium]